MNRKSVLQAKQKVHHHYVTQLTHCKPACNPAAICSNLRQNFHHFIFSHHCLLNWSKRKYEYIDSSFQWNKQYFYNFITDTAAFVSTKDATWIKSSNRFLYIFWVFFYKSSSINYKCFWLITLATNTHSVFWVIPNNNLKEPQGPHRAIIFWRQRCMGHASMCWVMSSTVWGRILQ